MKRHTSLRTHVHAGALALAVAAVLSVPQAWAQTDQVDYMVTTTQDSLAAPALGEDCTLREAIRTAGLFDDEITACGPGALTVSMATGLTSARLAHITFAGAGRGRIELVDQLVVPQVETPTRIWIDGAGASDDDPKVVLSGGDAHRILLATEDPPTNSPQPTKGIGEIHLRDLTLANGAAVGSALGGEKGGAVYTGPFMTLTVDRVTFTENTAYTGAAVYAQWSARLVNTTFAGNHVLENLALDFSGGTVHSVNGLTEIYGSTFFHNTAGTLSARDLAGNFGWGAFDLTVVFGSNVFVAPEGTTAPSCAYVSPDTDRPSDVGYNRRTGVPGDTSCLSTFANGSADKVDWLIEPVLDEHGNALGDYGGWVDTVVFTEASEIHDLPNRGFGFENFCSTNILNKADFLEPARVPTDARAVVRPTTACDAGALQRDAQAIDFPAPSTSEAIVGFTIPRPTATSGAPVSLTASPGSVCAVIDSGIALLAAGDCTARAEQPGTDLFRTATPVEHTFTVSNAPPMPQAITFAGAPAGPLVVGASYDLANVTSDSGLPVIVTVAAASTEVCSIDVNRVAHMDAVGTCTLEAAQAGNESYAPTAATLTIAVVQATPSFSGFSGPISQDLLNVAKAGQGIAVTFSLGGDWGLDIIAPGYPVSQQVACPLSSGTSGVSETVTVGKSGLSYDPVTQTYTYVWKTNKAWANTCRQLEIRFSGGGGTAKADFLFRR